MSESNVNAEYLTLTAGVALPALQAVVNGAFYGVACSGIVAVANHMELLDIPAWAVGVTAFSLAGLWAWRGLLDDWRGMLYGIEDLSPVVERAADPRPEIIPAPVRVELASNNGRSVEFLDLPAEPGQLVSLGSGIVEGLPFTESQWTGRGAPFSRGQFAQLRGEMIRRGLLAWNSQNDNARGVRVTGKGMALLRHFATMTDSPPTLLRKG